MRLLGFEISREKKGYIPTTPGTGGWWPIVREPFAGAWQRNITVDQATVLAYHAVYACVTLIASDIAKLRVKLVEKSAAGIWSETSSPAFSPVLAKPNEFQNRIQFWESYQLSKLLRGNTYVLKGRDNRRVVTSLYVLDPSRVKPLVTDDGDVYYEISVDTLAGVREGVTLPASEIIHDRWNTLFHPLVGLSPIYASGLAATQGLRIQTTSARFFGNDARPSGILTAPGRVDPENAKRLREAWEANQGGENAGRIAVMGDGLKYEALTMTAEDAQLVEQHKWSAEVVCSTFHVPAFMIGVGPLPAYNNVQALQTQYYAQCLQGLLEAAEVCMDEALGIGEGVTVGGKIYGTEFDIENLLRMDSVTQMDMLDRAKSIMTPDEQRQKLSLEATPGGNVVYRQQQDFSLAALAKRDAKEDPFGTAPAPKPAPVPEAPEDEPAEEEPEEKAFGLGDALTAELYRQAA